MQSTLLPIPAFIAALSSARPFSPALAATSAASFTPRVAPLQTPATRRLHCVARPSAARSRWIYLAASATPTPPPTSSDDDDADNAEGGAGADDSASSDSAARLDGPGSSLNKNFFSGAAAADDSLQKRSDDGSRDAEFNLDISGADNPDNNELFQFVKSIAPPELVQRFTQSAPPVVQNAIRETLVSMLGSLPPLAFYTNVSTMSANLVQLFHSSLVTGYMFRNAAYRLELTRTLDWAGLKALPSSPAEAPEIKGGVAIFKQGDGTTVEVPVDEYIGELRGTVSNLRDELQRERKGGNELLSFVSTMDKDVLDSLTKNAGDEVVDAMKKVVDFVTNAQGIDAKNDSVVEASAPELGQLLFYLMVSGFFLREAEVRLDLQRQIGGKGSLKNLLEGGTGPADTGPETPPPASPKSSP